MNTPRAFKERLLAGEQLMGTFINTASPAAAEACAMGGLDWALVDLEHGAGGKQALQAQIHALGSQGTAVVVRIASMERIDIGQALDAGADAVMIPRIGDLAQAGRVTQHLWYPPAGDRGVAGYTRARQFGFDGLTPAEVNDQVVGVMQIESITALAAATEIAALPGVDALFVGPSDLTAALGIPGQLDSPIFREAVDTVAVACRQAGIAAGILSFTTETIDRYAACGYTLHAVGSDANTLVRASKQIVAAKPHPSRLAPAGESRRDP